MPATRIADFPEPDRVEGAPHPRETLRLFGQSEAEAAFLEAFNAGRLHHAWLITGPRGLGKATLAWRIARFLLATPEDEGMFAPPPPQSLDIPGDHPVAVGVGHAWFALRPGLTGDEDGPVAEAVPGPVGEHR